MSQTMWMVICFDISVVKTGIPCFLKSRRNPDMTTSFSKKAGIAREFAQQWKTEISLRGGVRTKKSTFVAYCEWGDKRFAG